MGGPVSALLSELYLINYETNNILSNKLYIVHLLKLISDM